MKRNPKKEAENYALNEMSDIGKKYGFQISWPHGYLPTDVDTIIRKLEDDIANLTKDNLELTKSLESKDRDLNDLRSQVVKMQMEIQLMDPPDLSAEESMMMIGKMEGISPTFKADVPMISEEEIKRRAQIQKAQPQERPEAHIAQASGIHSDSRKPSDSPLVFNDLLSKPKKKQQGGK